VKYAEGSVLIELGETRVICTASVENKVPPFLKGQNIGWVTAEYSMLPRATPTRMMRETHALRPSGRTLEIQRLIGRNLRAVMAREVLGERTFWIDCDVIQADGGTRVAAVTGGFVAMALAAAKLMEEGSLTKNPIKDFLAGVSVGVIKGQVYLDLCYAEDAEAEVDMNVIMTEGGKIVEVQGAAEKEPFSKDIHTALLELAEEGIQTLIQKQKEIVEKYLPWRKTLKK
jgi:ribonuclease PH